LYFFSRFGTFLLHLAKLYRDEGREPSVAVAKYAFAVVVAAVRRRPRTGGPFVMEG